MILKASENARKKATDLLAAAEKGRQETAEQLTAIDAKIAAADKAMIDALVKGNADEYQREKAMIDAALDIKAANEKRRALLEGQALITAEEYKTICDAIIAEAEAKRLKAVKEIVSYIDKAAGVGADLCEALTDADEVLGIVQGELYRNADRPRDASGQPISWVCAKTVSREAWGLVEWIQTIIDAAAYRAASGRDVRGTLNIMEFLNK